MSFRFPCPCCHSDGFHVFPVRFSIRDSKKKKMERTWLNTLKAFRSWIKITSKQLNLIYSTQTFALFCLHSAWSTKIVPSLCVLFFLLFLRNGSASDSRRLEFESLCPHPLAWNGQDVVLWFLVRKDILIRNLHASHALTAVRCLCCDSVSSCAKKKELKSKQKHIKWKPNDAQQHAPKMVKVHSNRAWTKFGCTQNNSKILLFPKEEKFMLLKSKPKTAKKSCQKLPKS